MKMTNGEVLAAIPGLRDVLSKPLPVRASYRLARMAREMETAAKDVEEIRLRILHRFTDRDENGEATPVVVAGELRPGEVRLTDPAAFRAEVEELLRLEVELPMAPLEVAELGEDLRVSPATLLQLGPLLVESPAPEVAR